LFIEELSTRNFMLSQSPVLAQLAPPQTGRRDWNNQRLNAEAPALRLIEAILRSQPQLLELAIVVRGADGDGRLLRTTRLSNGRYSLRSDPLYQGEHDEFLGLVDRPQQAVELLSMADPEDPAQRVATIQSTAPFMASGLQGSVVLRSLARHSFDALDGGLGNASQVYLLSRDRPATPIPMDGDAPASPAMSSMNSAQIPQLGEGVSRRGSLVFYALGAQAGHGDIVLLHTAGEVGSASILRDALHQNLQIQLVLIVIFLIATFLVARYIAAPISRLRQTLAEKRENIDIGDLPEGSDADLQALFEVIVNNAERIREQQHNLAKRMQTMVRMQEELNEAYLQLKQSEADKNELVKVTAHDLREPLLVVKSCGALLPELVADQDLEGLEQTVGFIDTAISRMAEQLERMRRYFRIGDHGPPSQVAVADVCQQVIGELRDEQRLHNATVFLHGSGQLWAHPEDVRVLVYNLLDNALRYARDHAPCKIRVEVKREADALLLDVCDNGIGIDPENHEKIFRMFYRRGSTAGYRGGGTSLAECRKVARMLHGDITVQSNPDYGVTFHVHLRDVNPDIKAVPERSAA
jgi:signal transduction histidine kinase